MPGSLDWNVVYCIFQLNVAETLSPPIEKYQILRHTDTMHNDCDFVAPYASVCLVGIGIWKVSCSLGWPLFIAHNLQAALSHCARFWI